MAAPYSSMQLKCTVHATLRLHTGVLLSDKSVPLCSNLVPGPYLLSFFAVYSYWLTCDDNPYNLYGMSCMKTMLLCSTVAMISS